MRQTGRILGRVIKGERGDRQRGFVLVGNFYTWEQGQGFRTIEHPKGAAHKPNTASRCRECIALKRIEVTGR